MLKIIPLGGVGNVTKNMFVYETSDEILLVDCGIGFPDEILEKEELLMPNFSYLLGKKEKIKGLVITHAHFDHYGAVPHLLSKINLPIFATSLTCEFIKRKIEDLGFSPSRFNFYKISSFDKDIKIGKFQVTPFHINHSVPASLGFCLKTFLGNIFHVSDFKFDWTPVDEPPFDVQKCVSLAQQKPLLLLSDCLGATKKGHTRSERNIKEYFENIIIRTKGLVLVTTISSNISRIKQAVEASVACGRRVAFLGRSLGQSIEIAQKLGYFSRLGKYLIPAKKLSKIPPWKLTIIVAGSYGQQDSALVKIAEGAHPLVFLKKGDAVIFSADPSPPSVVVNVNKLIDKLSKKNAKVYYYEIQENLYVSGHGTGEDIKMLFTLVKPSFLLPIGGDFRHMRAYAELAFEMGYKEEEVFLLEEGQMLEFLSKDKAVVRSVK